jgi:serine/threonine-protein kinase
VDRDSRLGLGRAYLEVGNLTRQLDSIAEAQNVVERGVHMLEALSSEKPADAESHRALALGLKSLGLILTSVGRRQESLPAFRRSTDLFRGLVDADPSDRRLRVEWSQGESLCASSLLTAHRLNEALEGAERARAILEAVAGNPPAEEYLAGLVDANGSLAMILEQTGRRKEALAAYERARDLGEMRFQANSQDDEAGHELARNLGNQGICLRESGRPGEALAALERAREVLRITGEAYPTMVNVRAISAWIDGMRAETLVALGRDAEALHALERAQAAREALIKANPSVVRNLEQLSRVNYQIADIHQRAARTSEVLATFERAREFAAGLANAHPQEPVYRDELAAICTELGDRYDKAGKAKEALASFDQALSIHGQRLTASPAMPSVPGNVADKLRRRGIALHRCGRPADAVRDIRQSIDVLRGLKSPTPVDIYDIACCLSLIHGIALESGSGLTAADGRAAAEEAMTVLRQAVTAGYREVAWMKSDPDLAPIRSRPDFQTLMADMEFPDQPFASSDAMAGPASPARSQPER